MTASRQVGTQLPAASLEHGTCTEQPEGWSPLKIKVPCFCKHMAIYLIVGIGLQSIKRCRSINKRWWLSQACHWPSLVSLKQHLLSHENIYEITWLKRITCVLFLSQTKRSYDSQSYSWCIGFFFFTACHVESMDKSLYSASFWQWDKPSLQK